MYVNTAGTTSRLSSVEVIRPPITAMAMGERKLGSAPQPKASGSMPAPMAMEVITIGRLRLWQASTSASKRPRGVTVGRPSGPRWPSRARMA
jgi:hypothetical protein